MSEAGVVLQIASLAPPARFGGAERVVGHFAEALERAGFRVHNQGLKPRRHPGEPGSPINNIYWPFDGRRRGVAQRTLFHSVDTFTLAARRPVYELMKRLRPDVVITHNLRGWGYAPWVVAKELEIPLLHVVHDYGLLCNATTLWNGGVCEGVCAPCRPRLRATRRRWPGGQMVGVSAAVLDEHRVRKMGDIDDAVVVHPTAAAQDPHCSPRPTLDGVPTTVGYLGRLSEAKGIDLLVAAISGSGKRLIVAGEGEPSSVASLEALAAGQVEWRGWMNPGSLFDEIDVLVVPSVWLEPFGLVVVEAARAGVPVLISERPGLLEAARASGARHATFAAGDPRALREALDRRLDSYVAEPNSTTETDIVEVVSRLMTAGHRTGGAR
ncbi:glycosyltransferase [Mycobacterium sp. E740]|uniref:glycosyltransferase n=1 Tax=Mycobacterium sp. E740 TaxID=1834149 RepID=UPI0007FF8103|nr:glycosyltransferase [Mycobacterium sp. E740]OBI74858.1 hypothetical protein A5663_00440 [Mycobacterium sp. E740]